MRSYVDFDYQVFILEQRDEELCRLITKCSYWNNEMRSYVDFDYQVFILEQRDEELCRL